MLTFEKLWNSYPQKDVIKQTCYNRQETISAPFSDYCAIMLSEALIKAGASLNGFSGNKCWSHTGSRHALLAEQLANWLKTSPLPGLQKAKKISPGSFQSDLNGKNGIVFFKDYWQRGSESFESRSGDHIDLWKDGKITSGTMLYRSVIELFGFVSDLNKSKEIWFWEVK
ncbi:type VI secretion system amidase effector protein Tae4 [Microbulbifer sp. CnH-101-E]|uniref:type VI secretion system amidase effector protein Tae4 n=1 Tax=unclassified Microbulbifer TaxID=2619833 RepID=UPI0040396168